MCPACGARNNSDQPLCWQCRAQLHPEAPAGHVTPPPRQKTRKRPAPDARFLEQGLIFTALGATLLAIGLSIQMLRAVQASDLQPAATMEAAIYFYLPATRLLAGALLLAAWPAILHLAAKMLRLRFRRPSYFLTILGAFLASLAYCLSFLPWPAGLIALVAPQLFALGFFFYGLRLSIKRGLSFWLLQGAMTCAVLAVAVWSIESAAAGQPLNPIREFPAIASNARLLPADARPIPAFDESGRSSTFIWRSSGSVWLDLRVNRAWIEVPADADTEKWILSLVWPANNKVFLEVNGDGPPIHSGLFRPLPDVEYTIDLQPSAGGIGGATIYSLLPVAIRAGSSAATP